MLKRGKKLLGLLLVFVLSAALLPMTVSAAGTTVRIGNKTLTEGANTIGGGTATLDTAAQTLTLENVSVSESVGITAEGAFTVLIQGKVSLGSEAARINGSALYSWNAPDLHVQVAEGAVLALYTQGGNNIYTDGSRLHVSGTGEMLANAAGDYPALYSENISIDGGLQMQIVSDQVGMYAAKGEVAIENANVGIQAKDTCIFAQTYDSDTDEDIPSSVTLKNSTLDMTVDNTAEEADPYGIFCGTGGIQAENMVINSNVTGGALYSEGDITVTGAETQIIVNGSRGIESSDGTLKIEGGTVNVTSDDNALYGWTGIEITGGKVKVLSKDESAMVSREGQIRITGADTVTEAVSNAVDKAVIRNVRNGGIYLEAPVTLSHTAGGKLAEGVMKDKSVGITVGDGFDAFGLEVYTDQSGKSYFIPRGSEEPVPASGSVTICSHTWDAPVWTWTADHSGASAEFVCTQNAGHLFTEDAVITAQTTDPTCTKDGKTVYTAKVNFQGTEYTDVQSVQIPATGKHVYKDGKCTICGAADSAYKPADTGKTDKDKTDGTDKKTEQITSTTPHTGDAVDMLPMVVILLLSGACIAGVAAYGIKKRR